MQSQKINKYPFKKYDKPVHFVLIISLMGYLFFAPIFSFNNKIQNETARLNTSQYETARTMPKALAASNATIVTFANNGLSEPFYWLTRPSAVFYNNKTYVVWHGTNLDPYITYYDHITKTWAPVKRVADSPLSDDGHGAPSLQIDNSGYIYVFYGSHVSNQKWAKSASPESISNFIVQPDIVGYYTYPKPVKVGSSIYLFIRSNPYETYLIGNGTSWGSQKNIIEAPSSGRVYTGFMELNNNKIHMTWTYWHYSDPDINDLRNVFYAYLDLTDMNMYSITGRNLGTTVSQTEAETYCMVRKTPANQQSNMASMHFDSNGYPWIIYIEGNDPTFRFYHTRWTGSAWTTPAYITTTDEVYNYEDFKINSVTDVTVYLTTSGAPGSGGDIEQWHWDGSVWSKVSTILSASASGKPLGGANIPYNFNPELDLVFSQYLDDVFTDDTLKIYANLKVGAIGSGPSPTLPPVSYTTPAASPIPTLRYVTPTIYCLGSCPTAIPTPTPITNTTPIQPSTKTPAPTTPITNPSPTIDPCSTSVVSSSTQYTANHRNGNRNKNRNITGNGNSQNRGFRDNLIKWLLDLINYLRQLLGLKPIPVPATPPVTTAPTPTQTVTTTPMPSNGNIAPVPTVNNPTSVPAPRQCLTPTVIPSPAISINVNSEIRNKLQN